MHLYHLKRNKLYAGVLAICLTLSVFSDISAGGVSRATGAGTLSDIGMAADKGRISGTSVATGTDADSENDKKKDGDSDSSNNITKFNFDSRKEREDEQTSAEASKNTAKYLIKEIKIINDKIAKTSTRIEEISTSISNLDEQIAESERGLIEAEDRIKAEREVMGDALQMMYESTESDDIMTIILKSDEVSDIIDRDEYIADSGKFVNRKIVSLEKLLYEMEKKNNDLIDLREEREEELLEYEEIQEELKQELVDMSVLMSDAKKRAEDAEKLAKDLAAEVSALEAQERAVLGGRRYLGESSNVIYDGDGTDYYYESPYPYTEEDVKILAAIIQAEAGGVSYPGMVAVGSVIMNRVADSRFPNTLEGVIYAPYQFEPVQIGTFGVILAEGPVPACYQAAQEVLEGKRNVPNLYFKAAWYAEENGIPGVNIGGNVFH